MSVGVSLFLLLLENKMLRNNKLYAHVATVSTTDSNMLPLNKRLNEDLYLRLNSFSIPLTLPLEIRNNRRRNMSMFANDEK